MSTVFIDRTGQKYGKLLVIKRTTCPPTRKQKKVYWLCLCDCGKETSVESYKLATGHTQSCSSMCKTNKKGYISKLCSISNKDKNTPTGISYRAMIERCYYPGKESYQWYGERGIRVCSRWLGKEGYKNFKKDMGTRPSNKTLDRINPDKNYYPENCRWADSKTQYWNKRNFK